MGLRQTLETFFYKNVVVPTQGKATFDFVDDIYSPGQKVLDFGCGIGASSRLFHVDDYTGIEVDESRVKSARRKYPEHKFEAISYISTEDDRLPFPDNSFDIIFISLCLHHVDSQICKILFKEFRRVLNDNGKIIGLEPCVLPGKYVRNTLMNIIDVGHYILPVQGYKDLYASESFDTEEVNIIGVHAYNVWQYIATPQKRPATAYESGMTQYRKILRPIHYIPLYGKWCLLAYVVYYLLNKQLT